MWHWNRSANILVTSCSNHILIQNLDVSEDDDMCLWAICPLLHPLAVQADDQVKLMIALQPCRQRRRCVSAMPRRLQCSSCRKASGPCLTPSRGKACARLVAVRTRARTTCCSSATRAVAMCTRTAMACLTGQRAPGSATSASQVRACYLQKN